MKSETVSIDRLLAENAELKSRLARLEAEAPVQSEANFRALADNANDGILISAASGDYVYANKRASEISGYSIDELKEMGIKRLVHPDEYRKVQDRLSRRVRGQAAKSQYESVIVRKDKAAVPVEITASATSWQGQTAVIVILRDITERKRAEERLRDSERRYRILADNVSDLIWAVDADLKHTYVSPSAVHLIGYTPEECLGKPLTHFLAPKSKKFADKQIAMALDKWKQNGGKFFKLSPLVLEHARKDGTTFWSEDFANIVADNQGNFLGLVGVTRDITERKRAEEEIKKSEKRYRLLAENVSDLIWAVDADLNYTYLSPSIKDLAGFDPEDVLGKPLTHFLTPASKKLADELHPRAIARWKREGGKTFNFKPMELEHVSKDGATFWSDDRASVVTDDDGNLIGLMGVTRDITERKRAEDAVKKSEERYRLLAENVTDCVWAVDADLKYTYVSPSVVHLIGYTPEQHLGHPITCFLAPESKELADGLNAALLKEVKRRRGKSFKLKPLDLEHIHKDGSSFQGENFATIVHDDRGDFVGLVGVTRDVSERKQAEEALKKSEERFQQMARNIRDVFWMTRPRWAEVLYVSPAFEDIWRVPVETLYQNPAKWIQTIHPDDLEAVKANQERQLEGMATTEEFRIVLPGGQIRWIEDHSFPVVNPEGEIDLVTGVASDVTPRKLAEEALKKSEERYRLLSENTSDFVCLHDLEMRLLYVSPSIRDLTGWEPEEVLGRPVFEFMHFEDAQGVARQAYEDLARGRPDSKMENRIRKKDGEYLWLETLTRPIYDKHGHITQFQAVSRDITERNQAQAALQRAHDQLEDRVRERTDDLEKLNAALQVLLEHRDQERRRLERDVVDNVRLLVMPYLERLKGSHLDIEQRTYFNIAEANLSHIISPFAAKLTSELAKFTPTEIQVAGLIKDGKSSKEICEVLNLSLSAVSFHRRNIRSKLGLTSRRENLMQRLRALMETGAEGD